jgi:hypothetical protein
MLKNCFFTFLIASWRSMTKIADPDPNPDPLVRGMDPRIQIRIHAQVSWIRNIAKSTARTKLQTRIRLV